VSKTLREALFFNKKAVMGYDIDNNLLKCHGWKSVRKLVQDMTDSDLISHIKHRVGQMQQEERKRRLKKGRRKNLTMKTRRMIHQQTKIWTNQLNRKKGEI
jgi:hypothetical protein